MWQQQFTWFFSRFQHEFRKSNPIAFEVVSEDQPSSWCLPSPKGIEIRIEP